MHRRFSPGFIMNRPYFLTPMNKEVNGKMSFSSAEMTETERFKQAAFIETVRVSLSPPATQY